MVVSHSNCKMYILYLTPESNRWFISIGVGELTVQRIFPLGDHSGSPSTEKLLHFCMRSLTVILFGYWCFSSHFVNMDRKLVRPEDNLMSSLRWFVLPCSKMCNSLSQASSCLHSLMHYFLYVNPNPFVGSYVHLFSIPLCIRGFP